MDLFFYTFGLGVASTLAVYRITGIIFSPCGFYWIGWIVGIIGAELSAGLGLLPPINSVGHELILSVNLMAAVAFVLATLLSIPVRDKQGGIQLRTKISGKQPFFSGKYSTALKFLLFTQFLFGIFLLSRRLLQTGGAELFDIRQSYLEEAYLQDALPFVVRIFSFISLSALVAPFLLGEFDARKSKCSIRDLLLIVLASLPGGLSTGGRVWLASSATMYIISFCLYVEAGRAYKSLVPVFRRFAALVALLVLGFIGIANMRDFQVVDTGPEEKMGPLLKTVSPLLVYLGITVAAVGPYAEYAADVPHGYGRYSFPWVEAQLFKLGLIDSMQYGEYVKESRSFVFAADGPDLASTHSSIIPPFTADFGLNGVSVAIGIFLLVCQCSFFALRQHGELAMLCKVILCWFGGLFCFQDALLLTANAIVPVIALGVLVFRARLMTRVKFPLRRS